MFEIEIKINGKIMTPGNVQTVIEVAAIEAIEKDYPDIFIETLAYGRYTRNPPEGKFPLGISFTLADGNDIADAVRPQASRGSTLVRLRAASTTCTWIQAEWSTLMAAT